MPRPRSSGHGFKFASLVGETASDLALDGGSDYDVSVPHRSLLRTGRFKEVGALTRTIVCFGDSNTHGADPCGVSRLPRAVRWPRVMAAALGDDYEIIEEGLNGRTTVWDSPLAPGRNGLTYLLPCLLSHAPVDLVIIMLGTNDTKRIYGLTAPEIAGGASVLVDAARASLAGPDGMPPEVLLVSPVPLGEVTARSEMWGFGESRAESERLAGMYRLVADSAGAGFFDAGSVARVHPDDGVHLDGAACAKLGAALADVVRQRLSPKPV